MQQDYSYGIIPVYRNPDGFFEFLVIHQKTKSKRTDGLWGFPKGHREEGESPLEAAKREFQEEVGIKNISIKTDTKETFSYEFWEDGIHYHKKVSYRIGFVKEKNFSIQEEELLHARRLTYEEAKKQITHENMRKIFVKLTEKIGIE